MLSGTSPQERASFNTLRGNEHFQTIVQYLNENLVELNEANAVTRDDVLCRWNQGAIQALTDLLKLCEGTNKS